MSDDDLMQLYSRRILALASDIPHLGRLPAPQGSGAARSPQCGSTVSVEVAMDGETVTAFAQQVRACALGQASAAILGQSVTGASETELRAARDALAAMLRDGAPPPEGRFAALAALAPAKDFHNRHASILLAWNAALDAIAAARA